MVYWLFQIDITMVHAARCGPSIAGGGCRVLFVSDKRGMVITTFFRRIFEVHPLVCVLLDVVEKYRFRQVRCGHRSEPNGFNNVNVRKSLFWC